MVIKTLTVPEYFVFLTEFFEGHVCKGEIVKLVNCGMWNHVHYYLVPKKYKTPGEIVSDAWKYEPMLEVYYDNKSEYLKQVNMSVFDDISGYIIRCIFKDDEVVYQNLETFPDTLEKMERRAAEKWTEAERDLFMGFWRDPFTFVEPFKLIEGEYIDQGRNDPEVKKYNTNPDNYRVFYTEMTPDEYLDEEKRFLEHVKIGSYKDDFIIWDRSNGINEFTPEWKEFLIYNANKKC